MSLLFRCYHFVESDDPYDDRNALDNLTTQGIVFSTLDDQHFTLV